MKASLLAVSCILAGAVACTAPQGKKIAADGSGLAPVAAGPSGPATKDATVTEGQKGEMVAVYNQGTITVTLQASEESGYTWRLAEIPDESVLKLTSQDYTPPANGTGRGEEKWVFQAVGPGDVDVKLVVRHTRESSLSGNPSFGFIASVADQTEPIKKEHSKKKAAKKELSATR